MFTKRECGPIADMLWPAAAHRLKEADLERVERHLEDCAECRMQAEEYRQTVRLVAEYAEQPVPESEATWQSLCTRLEAPPRPVLSTPLRRYAAPWAWSGAALAAVALLLPVFGTHRNSTPPGKSDKAEGVVIVRKPYKSPLLPEQAASLPKPFKPSSAPEIRIENVAEKENPPEIAVATVAASRTATHRKHRRHSKSRLWSAPQRIVKADTLPKPAIKPAEIPSVDGDRPAFDKMRQQYVLTAVAPPTMESAVCDFVMEGVPVSATGGNSAPMPGSGQEMQAW